MTREKLEKYRINIKELKRFIEEYHLCRDLGSLFGSFDVTAAKTTRADLLAEENRLCKKVSDILKEKRAIEKNIENVKDASEALLLRYRYIDGYGWEEISELMNYSPRNIHYLHKKALRAVAAS